jgi:two-component system cell cycle sensor histidine kinase/response regulator CckA
MEAARLQAVGQLAGGVAHEINNHMTGVLGFTEFLLQSLETDDPKRGDLVSIRKAAQRSADITRQLLAFGRRQMLQSVVLDLNPLVAGTESLIRRVLGLDIALHIILGETVGQVRVDQAHLEQAVLNLVLNARDAMPEGGQLTIETTLVTVTSDAAPGPGDEVVPMGTYARLTVSDTGSGMDAVTKARIFEPFFTTKEIGRGTGLGLASVYGTVKQSGGLIWVESEPGQGTTFTLDFPQVIGTSAPKTTRPWSETPTTGSGIILVVEDEDTVRTWVARLLGELGYTVLEATNGAEALQRVVAPTAAVQLVLSDVVMPEMSGAELRARLAALRPDLPVLLMSGFAADELVRQGLVARGTAVLQKPFAGVELAHRIRESLAPRALGQ